MSFKTAVICCLVSCGCGAGAPTAMVPPDALRQRTESFFADWLKSHGHTDVVVDADGVGIAGKATRLRASLYGSDPQQDGGHVVELEFTVEISPQRTITEFVAGTADTEELAIDDALFNFAMSTFHPIYKAFINRADPHMTETPLTIGGAQRVVIEGDFFARGGAGTETLDLNVLRPGIEQALESLTLDPQPHWLKIVYGQAGGESITVAVTLDNQDHAQLTETVAQMPWPRVDTFYMAKQFIVIK